MRRAVLVLMLAGAVLAQQPPSQQNQSQQKCTVSGTVLNQATGEPLRKAHVEIVRDGSGQNAMPQGYSLDAGPDGSFRFEGIEPGSYRLSGEHPGFIGTELGSKAGFWGQGTRLTLKPGDEMNGIKLALAPQAVISGRVADEDGDPIEGAFVQLQRRMWQSGKQRYLPLNGVGTDDTGSFRISGIAPGKYFLIATPGRRQLLPPPPGKPDVRFVRTYYPDADTVENAAAVQLTAGQEMSAIDIRMRRASVHHIAGKILVSAGFNARNISLNIGRKGDFMFFAPSKTTPDGSFDFGGLEPGDYTIRTFPGSNNKLVINQTVQLGSSDIRDLVLTPLPPGELSGQVRTVGERGNNPVDLTSVGIAIRPSDGDVMMGFGQANANQDGSFKLENVEPGNYSVHVTAPDGTYLSSIRFRGQDVTGKTLDLTKSVSGDLEITIRTGAPKVTGTVKQNDDGQTADPPGAARLSQTVVLIPDALDDDGGDYYSSECDQSGAFTLKSVRPGHYMAVALQQLSGDLLGNPEFLRALAEKGTEVQVAEGENKQLQLALMADGDFHQVEVKAGVDQ